MQCIAFIERFTIQFFKQFKILEAEDPYRCLFEGEQVQVLVGTGFHKGSVETVLLLVEGLVDEPYEVGGLESTVNEQGAILHVTHRQTCINVYAIHLLALSYGYGVSWLRLSLVADVSYG